MLTIVLGQIEVIPGRPDLNTRTMLDEIAKAKQSHADLIIFPELCIPGYLLGDTWEQPAFLRDCENYGRQIIEAANGIGVLFGNVAIDWDKRGDDGRVRKYNALFAAQDGRLAGQENFPYPFRIKTLQPNYREFEDTRHFFSLRKLAEERGCPVKDLLKPVNLSIRGKTLRLGCILCEDGWSSDYGIQPIAMMCAKQPVDLLVNISSSPFTSGKNNKRNRVFSQQVKACGVPLIYVNNVGLQNNGKTVYTFDGCSTVYDRNGDIAAYSPSFQPDLKLVRFTWPDCSPEPAALPVSVPDDFGIESTYQALEYGIRKFLAAIGMNRVVIGISGGIDSAVSAALYAKILGPENVLLVNMPTVFNSNTTKGLAQQLAKNLGCLYAISPIQEFVDRTAQQIEATAITDLANGQERHLTVTPFVFENIQARDRSARILAGMAAAFGGGFTCNANKSEMTVGYCTLYGDEAGFLAALADLWKHQVYQIAAYINQKVYGRTVIPEGILTIVPSAELSHDQAVDEGKGDPIRYPYHDYLFRAFMEHWNRATPEDILTWYTDGSLESKLGCEPGLVQHLFSSPEEFVNDLERWWKLYTGMGVAKRIQAPPVIAVSRRAYGFDHREAQNRPYFTQRYEQLKNQLLHAQ